MRLLPTAAGVRMLLAVATALATLVSPTTAAPPEDDAAAAADTTVISISDDDSPFEHHFRHARPMIGIRYAFGDVDRDGFAGNLADVGALDLQLGFRAQRDLAGEETLIRQDTHFGHVGHLASRLASDTPAPNEVGTDMWRFGFGFGTGYGYRVASQRASIVLQNTNKAAWYTLDVEGSAVGGLSAADAAALDQFTSHTRYGEAWEASVEVGVGKVLAVHAGYERTAVFPSFKIWYWLLSTVIESGAVVAVDAFGDAVEDASPFASPVVRFVLEGALQYGFYELRTEEVNWPFDTEPPLMYDMFVLGLTTRF